jgi:nucleotide-binding universal stress UspA family protein
MVLVTPGTAPWHSLKRAVVAIDGTPGSAAGLAIARRLAVETGIELALVQVVAPLPRYAQGWQIDVDWEGEQRQLSQSSVDLMADSLRGAGISATGWAEVGPVAETVVSIARRAGADLIIMGTHGSAGLARAVLGSIAAAVVHRSPLPVMLVKLPERSPD